MGSCSLTGEFGWPREDDSRRTGRFDTPFIAAVDATFTPSREAPAPFTPVVFGPDSDARSGNRLLRGLADSGWTNGATPNAFPSAPILRLDSFFLLGEIFMAVVGFAVGGTPRAVDSILAFAFTVRFEAEADFTPLVPTVSVDSVVVRLDTRAGRADFAAALRRAATRAGVRVGFLARCEVRFFTDRPDSFAQLFAVQ